MKRVIKYIFILPCYIFLAAGGFIGGVSDVKDIWDELVTTTKK